MDIRNLDEDDFWESLLIEYVFGIPYNEYETDESILTIEIIENSLEKAINYLENVRKGIIKLPERYYLRDKEYVSAGYHILGLLIIEKGAYLPKKLKVRS